MNELFKPLDNPLRIKITGKCNRNCSFCHQEGNMDIDTIIFTHTLRLFIERLSRELGIHSIALTGGEPLLHPDLETLTKQLITCDGINRISLTTNGTIWKPPVFWEKMKENGLNKINISMPDILEYVSNDYHDKSVRNSVIINQIRTIRLLNQLGIKTVINIAVINDVYYTKSILNFLNLQKDLVFDIVLLPNLSNRNTYQYSEEIISKIIQSGEYRHIGNRERRNTSDIIRVYKNDSPDLLYVKGTMFRGEPFYLNSICNKCDKKLLCQEGFYGLRLEQIDDELYVRFCIHKKENGAIISVKQFFDSLAYHELKELWTK